MACLGDASRFRLVQALLGGARCVTELAGDVGLSQSCTTRHLQALERRGVVCGARTGKRVMYRLCTEQPQLRPLLAWALTSGPIHSGNHDSPPAGRPAGDAPAGALSGVEEPEPETAPPRIISPIPSAPSRRSTPSRNRSELEDFLL